MQNVRYRNNGEAGLSIIAESFLSLLSSLGSQPARSVFLCGNTVHQSKWGHLILIYKDTIYAINASEQESKLIAFTHTRLLYDQFSNFKHFFCFWKVKILMLFVISWCLLLCVCSYTTTAVVEGEVVGWVDNMQEEDGVECCFNRSAPLITVLDQSTFIF